MEVLIIYAGEECRHKTVFLFFILLNRNCYAIIDVKWKEESDENGVAAARIFSCGC